ncbi:hypothetical protein L6273_06370, partial [Candidatus Parcubacteria bacterium]|nr:hypothetical protein [Candidatus Parcubacteria bacterium]
QIVMTFLRFSGNKATALPTTEKSLFAKVCERGRHHFSNKRRNQKSFFVFHLGKRLNQFFRKRKN